MHETITDCNAVSVYNSFNLSRVMAEDKIYFVIEEVPPSVGGSDPKVG